jgi:hypothetical protein
VTLSLAYDAAAAYSAAAGSHSGALPAPRSTRSPYALHLPGREDAYCRFGDAVVPATIVDAADFLLAGAGNASAAAAAADGLALFARGAAAFASRSAATPATPAPPFALFAAVCVTPPQARPGAASVALSFNGGGARGDFSDADASPPFLYVAAGAPHALRAEPRSGPADGGTLVTVFGLALAPTFGAGAAANAATAAAPGVPGGTGSASGAMGAIALVQCRFGDLPPVPAVWASAGAVACRSPAFPLAPAGAGVGPDGLAPGGLGARATVELEVTANGQDFSSQRAQFTFEAPRRVTRLVPASGPAGGGTSVLVLGAGGFANVSSGDDAGGGAAAAAYAPATTRATRLTLGELRCRFGGGGSEEGEEDAAAHLLLGGPLGEGAQVRGEFVGPSAVRCVAPPLPGRASLQLVGLSLAGNSLFLPRGADPQLAAGALGGGGGAVDAAAARALLAAVAAAARSAD